MRYLLFIFALMLPLAAQAVEPDEILQDPVLEARARVVSKELRCVVCQNQDIDSSNAGVARDLRLLVRERLVAGDTNAQVVAYIQARYGDFVLLSPPFKPETYVLWLAPPALALFAFAIGVSVLRRSRRKNPRAPLSAAEETEIDLILATVEKGDAP
tara:strand:+ start:958 stop:1428 length:471 start_codon:yes stop_codon:yes gene_type:complete